MTSRSSSLKTRCSRQQPGTPSTDNSSYASVTELGITESEHELEHHKMMKVEHGIVEADLGPADPGPVLLPEPTNTEHMIRCTGKGI